MNVILIVADSLRRDHVSCYHGQAGDRAASSYGTRTHTPHLEHLSERSVVFDNHYAASFPTGPHRLDLHMGRFTFPELRWSALQPSRARLAPVLKEAGITTLLAADTPAIVGGGYSHGFSRTRLVRHWEGPSVASNWMEARLPADPRKLRRPERVLREIAFDAARRSEADHYCAQTFRNAADLLEEHVRTSTAPFFLCADTFDPHEPWFPPRWYLDRYDPGYSGETLIEPAYEPEGYCTADEIDHMRKRYAATVTMVDVWIGHLLWTVERLGLMDDTALIVTTDHGFYLADHGLIGKVRLDREDRIVGRYPLYGEMVHTPLVVSLPGAVPGRNASFVQPPDLTATVLDLLGVAPREDVQGTSIAPLISGREESIRDWAISSLTFVQDEEVRSPSTLFAKEWTYVYGGDEAPCSLFRASDAFQREDVADGHPDMVEEMHRRYLEVLAGIGCSTERIEGRRSRAPRPETRSVPTRFI